MVLDMKKLNLGSNGGKSPVSESMSMFQLLFANSSENLFNH